LFITLCATICGADNWVAIDGKCLRRSIDTASNKAAIYMVSAWSRQNSLVLGQVKVDDKSNEITAIPKPHVSAVVRVKLFIKIVGSLMKKALRL
jgi:hypothetical protein